MFKPRVNGSASFPRHRVKGLAKARRKLPQPADGSVQFSLNQANPALLAPVELHDKQSERDHRELRIDKVGVRGLRFPIQVRDKAHAVQNTVATIGMFVDLPKEFKGTHMSRFPEVLNAHGNVIHGENMLET